MTGKTEFLFILAAISFLLHTANAVECTDTCTNTPANLSVMATSSNATVTWSNTFGASSPSYSVQHRRRNSGLNFILSPVLSGLTENTYVIDGLESSVDYEVQVCLTDDTSNCGGCLLCFRTSVAIGTPSEPQNVRATSNGPRSFTVEWDTPTFVSTGIENYTVFYGPENEGLTVNVTIVNNAEQATISAGVSSNTTYVIAVLATSLSGSGPMSDMVTVTTESFSDVPGALLVAFESKVVYYRIAEEANLGANFLNIPQLHLFNTNTTVLDFDYDFRRGALYAILNNGLILQYNITIIESVDAVTLTETGSSVLYSDRGDLTNIAVDWVNDVLYWVEMNNGMSQIYSGPLTGGPVTAHGQPFSGAVESLTVDPIHGYFYWVVVGSTLVQVNMSSVTNADSSTDLTVVPRVVLATNASSFALDLADSEYFYVNSNQAFRRTLGNNEPATDTDTFMAIPTLRTSFSGVSILSSDNFLVFRADGQAVNSLGSNIINVNMLRSSYQPVPTPPGPVSNIRVLAQRASVFISWTEPQFVSNTFGMDAFNSWSYYIRYKVLGSSDMTSEVTTSTNITIHSLTPGTTYTFTISVRGLTVNEEVTTPNSHAFSTFGSNATPILLVTTDEGLLLVDTFGSNSQFLTSGRIDGSSGVASNAHFSPARYYAADGNGDFTVVNGSEPMSTNLRRDIEPKFLQLDWISRRLYWVEESIDQATYTIYRVPTFNLTQSESPEVEQLVMENGEISGMDVDALNGVAFWVTGTTIRAKPINRLEPIRDCYTHTTKLEAITTDPANSRLFVVYLAGASVYIATMSYTTYSCDMESFTSRLAKDLTLEPLISITYAANTLYLSQYNLLQVKSVTAEFASIAAEDELAIGCINVVPDSNQPDQLKALSTVLIDNQPLPNGFIFNDQLTDTELMNLLTPPIPGTPMLNEVTSNTTFIDVFWNPPNFNFSDVYYRVELNLTSALGEARDPVARNILQGNSVQATNQTFSTQVDATVTPYSLWFTGAAVYSSFLSPATLPSKVQNVRAYVFFPIRNDTSLVTAQIVWNGLSVEEAGALNFTYSINVTDVATNKLITVDSVLSDAIALGNNTNASWNGPPFVVNGDSTEFTIILAGDGRILYYPLKEDSTYSVVVNAINMAGPGEASNVITFTTNATQPPLEVLVVTPTGGTVLSNESDDTSIQNISPPLAINTANRTIYYFRNTSYPSIYRGSLDPTIQHVELTRLPNDLTPLAFTYDWISQTVYIIGQQNNRIAIWTVFDPNPVPTLLVELSISVQNTDNVSVIINPYRGFLQWTQQNVNDISLYQLNLRNNEVITLTSSRSNRRKRNIDIATVDITKALAWDPFTQQVYLCDVNTGNIIVCNVSATEVTNCDIAVNGSIGNGVSNGLPADQLAIDEVRIYWNKDSESTVYYTDRANPTTLQTLSASSSDFVLVGVSPGQQPSPDTQVDEEFRSLSIVNTPYCLSPDFRNMDSRPVPILVAKTNTTFDLRWNVIGLPSVCESVVFSFLPLTYRVEISYDNMPQFIQTVFENMTTINGLLPYTEYSVEVEARNQYSLSVPDSPDLFGQAARFRTEEGIPSDITNLQLYVYGPGHIYAEWTRLDVTELRGSLQNQVFIVSLNGTTKQDGANNTFDSVTLDPDTPYSVGVAVSNGVLRSSTVTESIQTFPLPPEPQAVSISNTTMNISVTFTPNMQYITEIDILINDELVTNIQQPDTTYYQFIGDLTPATDYNITVQAKYETVNLTSDVVLGPVIDNSSSIITTDTAKPDAPEVELEGSSILSWMKPKDNGLPITEYRINYDPFNDDGNTTAAGASQTIQDAETLWIDLNTFRLAGGTYNVTINARNSKGFSLRSNGVTYVASEAVPFYMERYFIAAVAGGGGFLLIVIFFMLLGICCCCCCTPPDKRASFRPDYELIRLREEYAKSRQHAFNPNYMWTRDDYTTYQDDLDNINKFPRNKLRLENFIDRGEFGEVYQGTAIDILAVDSGPTPVAVKTMRKGASHEEKDKFLSEAALMSNFNHQNIVKVLGVCLDNDPLFIIMELMPAGDLLKFLRQAKQESGPPLLTLAELVQVAIDVAQGCRYLEQQHFIHRDIAARNCLVSSKGADRVVKIGDFGLAKDLYTSDYYQVEGQRKLPVRWMAPEALLQGKFTIETDIWSYGVLLWEIFTYGNQPYPGRNNQEVLQFVTGGGRLDKPDGCSIRVYKLMQACWETSPSERLHFAQTVEYLAHYLEHVNNKRDSYYSDDEDDAGEDGGEELNRKPSKPSRTSSVRSVGLISLARQGSVRIRRSIRVRSSLKKDDIEGNQNHIGLNSEENLVDDDRAFRERGPF